MYKSGFLLHVRVDNGVSRVRVRVDNGETAWKCLECRNATVSVDEGTNITSANQRSS